MKKKRGVLFDFDGTIFDSLGIGYRATCVVFERAGCIPPSYDDFWLHCHAPFEMFYQNRGVNLSSKEIWKLFLGVADFDTATFFPDVVPVLQILTARGFALGVVSGNTHQTIQRCCDRDNLTPFFTAGIFGDVGNKTPVIEDWCSAYEVPRTRTWYVGDFVSDMRQARVAGVCGVGIMRGNKKETVLHEAGASFCINTLHDLLPKLGVYTD